MWGLAALCGASLLVPHSAAAIPAFARKYETSCQTCHVTFPKLTPFGDAFRRNGYRWPAGEEEDTSQDEPVPLGHEAHKKVFPKAVWPGTIPGKVPLAAAMGSNVRYQSEADANVDFTGIGANVSLNFSATLDNAFSTWAGAAFRASSGGGAEAELERVIVVIQPLEGPVLNIRVGRFESGASMFTIHRTLGVAPWYLVTPVQDASFTIDPAQVGLEANGIAAGRLSWAVGLVEGQGIVNTPKDVYARVAYKLGGMQPDGVGGASEAKPWQEKSVEAGVFSFYGQNRIGVAGVAEQDNTFVVGGVDLSVLYKDLNVLAAFTYEQDQHPSLDEPTEDAETLHAFVQADYVVFPWLIPTVRYEHRDVAGTAGDRVSGGCYVLLRANVRTQVLASVSDTGDGMELDQVTAGLNLAF